MTPLNWGNLFGNPLPHVMYQIVGSGEQVPDQPVGAFEFDGMELLGRLRIEKCVECFAPVSPPRAILDEAKVPFHVDAARRNIYFSAKPQRGRNRLQSGQAGHGGSELVISIDTPRRVEARRPPIGVNG
jgi:hypothetical protein